MSAPASRSSPTGSVAAQVLGLLTERERGRAARVGLLLSFTAVLEAFGVASVFPLLVVLTDPPRLEWLPLGTSALTALAISLVLTALAARVLVRVRQLHLAEDVTRSLADRLLLATMNRPFVELATRSRAELAKQLLGEVDSFVQHGLLAVLNVASGLAVVLAVGVVLALIGPWVVLLVGATLVLLYLTFSGFARRAVMRVGREHFAANEARFAHVGELLAGVRHLKVHGHPTSFTARTLDAFTQYARSRTQAALLGEAPRHVLELLGLLGLIALALAGARSEAPWMPILGAHAVAAFRLLPALQRIHQGLTALRFVGPTLASLARELEGTCDAPAAGERVDLHRSLRAVGVRFRYPGSPDLVVDDVTFTLGRGEQLAIAGPSGAGKTTLLDLCLGLLEPDEGTLWVDDHDLSDASVRQWQKSIGYVPQRVHLLNESLLSNITYGSEVELDRALTAYRDAQLDELDARGGLTLRVGDDGAELSEGQRQRVGIARALYRAPTTLVLDEATNALDEDTEHRILLRIRALGLTTLLVTHRRSALARCDRVMWLEAGRVVDDGLASEVLERRVRGPS